MAQYISSFYRQRTIGTSQEKYSIKLQHLQTKSKECLSYGTIRRGHALIHQGSIERQDPPAAILTTRYSYPIPFLLYLFLAFYGRLYIFLLNAIEALDNSRRALQNQEPNSYGAEPGSSSNRAHIHRETRSLSQTHLHKSLHPNRHCQPFALKDTKRGSNKSQETILRFT